MLYLDTIYPATLDLLKKIMALPELSKFNLAGGTALALQIGHRISIDLDFFGKVEIDSNEILNLLPNKASVSILTQSKNILILNIKNIKVDFVNYQYPLLAPLKKIEGIRLLSILDIAAMKLAAIAGRGKKRDFFDLYFLLQQHSLKEVIQAYNKKYHDGSEFMVVKSLVYFEDAEEDESPVLLKTTDWNSVKSFIQKEVNQLYG